MGGGYRDRWYGRLVRRRLPAPLRLREFALLWSTILTARFASAMVGRRTDRGRLRTRDRRPAFLGASGARLLRRSRIARRCGRGGVLAEAAPARFDGPHTRPRRARSRRSLRPSHTHLARCDRSR